MKRRLQDEPCNLAKRTSGKLTTNREVTTVLVSNLPKSYNQAKICKYFQDCGQIARVDVKESINRDSRLARVEFTSFDEAISALTKTFKKIGSNEIKVSLLQGCTVWITNFPPNYSQRDIIQIFQSIQTLPLSVRFPSLRFNSNRRFAYVDVSSPEEAAKAINELNGKVFNGFSIVVKRSDPSERTKRSDSGALEGREILIRHIDLEKTTEESLRHQFANHGEIEAVKIPQRQEKGSKDGYAFVTFREQSSANLALKVKTIDDKEVQVSLADRKAYLERQKVKKIMNRRTNDDRLISLFPLNDRTSKTQIESLLLDKVNLQKEDISDVFLVTDNEGALVLLREARLAAKCAICLNGIDYQKKTLHCGTAYDLRRHKPGSNGNVKTTLNAVKDTFTAKVDPSKNQSKLSNEDFRKLFLGK